MRCYACHQINDAQTRFCIECGAALTPTVWAQPAPAEAAYVPLPYAPPPPAANMVSASVAPGMYQAEAAQVNAYAPYGYIPAPAPGPAPYGYVPAPPPAQGPSLVNNVTVHQVSPTIPPPVAAPAPPAKARGKRRASDLVVLLAALYFLASGAVIGALWTTVHGYDGSTEIVAALAITVVALLIDIMILARITRQ